MSAPAPDLSAAGASAAEPERNSEGQSHLTGSAEEGGRQRWTSQIEFTITCIGYAVGLGNFWRF
eukprot:4417190-Prymnesium_polylepis.1